MGSKTGQGEKNSKTLGVSKKVKKVRLLNWNGMRNNFLNINALGIVKNLNVLCIRTVS